MNIVKISVLFLISIMSMACAARETAFEITVTGAEQFPDDARVIVYREKTVESPQRIEYLTDLMAFSNGVFSFTGNVDDPHIVSLDVRPADDAHPYTRVTFVLEPGETAIHFTSRRKFTLKGGEYSELVVNSWNEDKAYQAASDALNAFRGDFTVPEQREAFSALNSRVNDLKRSALAAVVNNSSDPMAKLLAYGAGYFPESRDAAFKEIMSLCKELEGKRQADVAMNRLRMLTAAEKARSAIRIGTVIKDFTAENLAGDEFHLQDVLKKNKYVLVEFWASWCGPCRAEIPHMKKAYENFNKKGFEIVSFTLDDDRDAWEDASEEEEIPWIDTGDLLAMTSPVVKMYGVTGVPANYLVEGATGKIVAKDLRQDALDNKLAELLGH